MFTFLFCMLSAVNYMLSGNIMSLFTIMGVIEHHILQQISQGTLRPGPHKFLVPFFSFSGTPKMDYLYTETTISSPTSNILLTEKYILAHHHSTVRIFDQHFSLLREKYFYERIFQIRPLEQDGFIILFDGGKIVQLDYEFNPKCLRLVQALPPCHHMDVYTDSVLVHNKIGISHFLYNRKEMKELLFRSFGIKNVLQVIFMANYIPTVLIVWRSNESTKCSLITLDSGEVTEEFALLEGLLCAQNLDKLVIFVYRSYIQLYFKRELKTIALNPDMPAIASTIFSVKNTPITVQGGSVTLEKVCLEAPAILMRNNVIYLFNQDCSLYKIALIIDVKKLTGCTIVAVPGYGRPTALAVCGGRFAIGSCEGDSVLYEFYENGDDFTEVSRMQNHGRVSNVFVKPSREIVCTSSKNILVLKDMLEFKILETVKLDFRAQSIHFRDDKIVVAGKNGPVLYSTELKPEATDMTDNLNDIDGPIKKLKTEGFTSSSSRAKIFSSDGLRLLQVSFDGKNSSLSIYSDDTSIRDIRGVLAYNFSSGYIAYVTSEGLFIYSVDEARDVFFSSQFGILAGSLPNEKIVCSDSLEEITENSVEEESREGGVPIPEIFVKYDHFLYILVKSKNQFHAYRLYDNALHKIFIPKFTELKYDTSFFDMGSFVYIRGRIPYCLFLHNGFFLHKCNLRFSMGCFKDNMLFFLYKGNLIKTVLPTSPHGYRFDSSFITEPIPFASIELSVNADRLSASAQQNPSNNPSNQLSAASESVKSGTADNPGIERFSEVIESAPFPKNIIYTEDSIVLVTARYVDFTFVPFIPMVHMASGPNNAPVSEPINKDEPVNPNPVIMGRTLRFTISLHTLQYEFISSFELEKNEFVCDIKLLFSSCIVLCTTFCEGEDKMARGRIIVYSLVTIVPDPATPHINKKLKLITVEQLRTACLYCQEVRGLLAVCIGTRLMIYEYNENIGLTAVGRNEISLLSTSLFIIKNFILISDIHRGVSFFFLRPANPLRLHLLGQSAAMHNVRHVQGIVGSLSEYPAKQTTGDADAHAGAHTLHLVAYSRDGVIRIFTYSPLYLPSGNGANLIKRAEIDSKIEPTIETCSAQLDDSTPIFISNNILTTVRAASVPGKIHLLQRTIASSLHNTCGINPRNYLQPADPGNIECAEVLSTQLLLEFFFLDLDTQSAILEALGLAYDELFEAYNSIFIRL